MCCPRLSVTCPTNPALDGERVTFSAEAMALGRKKYRWQVSAGKIVSGQGTLRIIVDTSGVGGRTITATVEMNDGHNHTAMSSCNVPVSVRPSN